MTKPEKMKKKVLIIRSVSFQQLDKNLGAITRYFPGCEFHLLTHGHGIGRAGGYTHLSEIIDYGSRKNFTVFHVPNALTSYDAVVVPVTNKTGAGFTNVLAMTLRIPAKKVFICNLTSDIWKVPRGKIVFHALRAVLFSFFSLAFTFPMAILMFPVLLVFFIGSRFRR